VSNVVLGHYLHHVHDHFPTLANVLHEFIQLAPKQMSHQYM
jgi:hypothetical protein